MPRKLTSGGVVTNDVFSNFERLAVRLSDKPEDLFTVILCAKRSSVPRLGAEGTQERSDDRGLVFEREPGREASLNGAGGRVPILTNKLREQHAFRGIQCHGSSRKAAWVAQKGRKLSGHPPLAMRGRDTWTPGHAASCHDPDRSPRERGRPVHLDQARRLLCISVSAERSMTESQEKPDQAFIEEYRPLVLSIVSKLRAQYDLRSEQDDLVSAGFEGLLQAKARFDPERGVQFNTFAYYRIRGAVIDAVRKGGILSRRAYARLKAAKAALDIGEDLGETRAADPAARADAANTAKTLHDTLAKLTTSFVMASVGQDEHEHIESADEMLVRRETRDQIRKVLSVLPERELALVQGFYFEGRRFDHVAEELGISKSWASRLHTKALSRLREALAEGE